MNHNEALRKMRQLSRENIPFSFSFLTYSEITGETKGVKKIEKGILRTGLSDEHGIKSQSLIGYVDVDTNENRWFYAPLLLTFENERICSM